MSTELVPVGEESPFAVLRMAPDEAQELLQDALGGDTLSFSDLDRIKVPSGGGQSWEIPSLTGDVSARVLEGVIVHKEDRRAYWPYTVEDRPDDSDGRPDCQSTDLIMGIGSPGGECSSCPFNEFNSDIKGGPGKACKETRQLFVLTKNDLLPIVLTVPPTSLRNVREYFVRLLRAQVSPLSVVTSIGLEKADNGKFKFSKVTLTAGERLTPDATGRLRAYAEAMMPAMKAQILVRNEVDGS